MQNIWLMKSKKRNGPVRPAIFTVEIRGTLSECFCTLIQDPGSDLEISSEMVVFQDFVRQCRSATSVPKYMFHLVAFNNRADYAMRNACYSAGFLGNVVGTRWIYDANGKAHGVITIKDPKFNRDFKYFSIYA